MSSKWESREMKTKTFPLMIQMKFVVYAITTIASFVCCAAPFLYSATRCFILSFLFGSCSFALPLVLFTKCIFSFFSSSFPSSLPFSFLFASSGSLLFLYFLLSFVFTDWVELIFSLPFWTIERTIKTRICSSSTTTKYTKIIAKSQTPFCWKRLVFRITGSQLKH